MGVKEHLDLVPGGSLTDITASDGSHIAVPWDYDNLKEAANLQLFKAATMIADGQSVDKRY